MQVLILIYDDYAEFEISILDTMLRANGIEVKTCAEKAQGEYVISSGGLQIVPHHHVNEIDANEFSALIIPGGRPNVLLGNESIQKLIRAFHTSKQYIAAICAGPSLLADAGLLEDIDYTTSIGPDDEDYKDVFPWGSKVDQFLVTDENVITATGSAYVEFAEEVMRKLGVVDHDDPHPLRYFKEPGLS